MLENFVARLAPPDHGAEGEDVRGVALEKCDAQFHIPGREPALRVEPEKIVAARGRPAEQAGIDETPSLTMADNSNAAVPGGHAVGKGDRLLAHRAVAQQDLEILEALVEGRPHRALDINKRVRQHDGDTDARVGHVEPRHIDLGMRAQDRA